MNGMRPLIEGYLDLNIVLMIGVALWGVTRLVLARTVYGQAFVMQRKLLVLFLTATMLSPFLAFGITEVLAWGWPKHSLALSDLAVSVFLEGHIDMPAVAFEHILTTRQRVLDLLLNGDSLFSGVFVGLVITAASVMALRLVFGAMRVRRVVLNSFPLRRSGKVEVKVSQSVAMPFAVRGFRRRYVIVPDALVLRPNDLRLVLSHEFLHIRKCDTELELLFEAIRPFFFWNPAFHLFKGQFDQLRELSCDQSIVNRGQWSAQSYARCLLRLCEQSVGGRQPHLGQVGFTKAGRARGELLNRVRALKVSKTHASLPSRGVVLALGLGMGCMVTFGAATLHPKQDWSQDRLMLSTVVNLERLDAINQGF